MLKGNLRNAPILSLPDESKEFVVYCDAANQGIGYVLMQRGKVENATAEMLHGLDQLMERKEGRGMYLLWIPLIGNVRTLMMEDEAHASRYLVHSGADKTYYDLRDMYGGHVWRRILLPILYTNEIVTRHGVHVSIISDRDGKIYFAALVDIAEGIENTTKTCDTHLPLTEFSIIIVIIRVFDVLYLKRCMEGSVGHMFFGLKLEKFGRLDQNWYKRQQIRVEVGDKVMLEVSSWKDEVHFGKKEMLAPRYVGPFEIIKGIGPMAY
ncbi:putative reverse transcriptase domain-containing protein [Tanacetum coccineum]